MSARPRPPDEDRRQAAVAERERNVVVDAGAGTGKTTLLVDRLMEMVAPAAGGPAVPLPRIAAITFTRKAAGELRLRVRERLLAGLAAPGLDAVRRRRLAEATAALDTAHIGTVHGFADRLLRLRPVEAGLSPSYRIVDDPSDLVRETFAVLMQSVQAGTLAQELAGRVDPERAREAQEAVLDALRAGLRPESRELEWTALAGLDALFAGFIQSRDVPPPDLPAAPFALPTFRRFADELVGLARGVAGPGAGSRWMAGAARRLAGLREVEDPVAIFLEVGKILRAEPGAKATKGVDFDGDGRAWDAWHAWIGKERKRNAVRATALRGDLLSPLHRWMATRLCRAFRTVVEMYEKVKERRQTLDQVDLLLRLRDLLRDDRALRGDLQGLFDHLFVDEFQDTDPLQAEIVLYLCERETRAGTWTEVELAPGKLTLVGDPKQSIYRFRRADIAVYDAVRGLVARGPHLAVSLVANFRSEPGLVGWLNDRFDRILGAEEEGKPDFDPAGGTVVNRRLLEGRAGQAKACVTALPYDGEDRSAGGHRAVEARAMARYLRWMVEGKKVLVADPGGGARRPAGYGDVAVLAASTYHLDMLFAELDLLGIPYAARGGVLFLADPLHRQFLLGLRAVADRDDGVAQAALLRPPFFSLELAELVRERGAPAGSADPGVRRARAALDFVRELRRRRLARPPGETARDLLEETGFARVAALGPNGSQRLGRLRELCLEVGRVAAAEGLDYDGATARLRDWAAEPVPLDPPRPVAGEALQVLTVHQAKGLEFPVVALWDGRAGWEPRQVAAPWTMDRDGRRWAMAIDGLEWEEPAGADILGRERKYLAAERRRLAYVAATRARDRLLLPLAGEPDESRVTGSLLAGSPEGLVERLDPFLPGEEPAWAREIGPPAPRFPAVAAGLATKVEGEWAAASREAARARFAPAAVAGEAAAEAEDEAQAGTEAEGEAQAAADAEGEAGERRKERRGRHGRLFGDTVHRAIGIALRSPALGGAEAVRRAARETGLREKLEEAAADVGRALEALERAGLRREPGPDLRLEYPVAAARDGKLYTGYVDLLAAGPEGLDLVDFKTDRPPDGDLRSTHPEHAGQVRAYSRILAELGAGRPVRSALLYTADGSLRWVE